MTTEKKNEMKPINEKCHHYHHHNDDEPEKKCHEKPIEIPI